MFLSFVDLCISMCARFGVAYIRDATEKREKSPYSISPSHARDEQWTLWMEKRRNEIKKSKRIRKNNHDHIKIHTEWDNNERRERKKCIYKSTVTWKLQNRQFYVCDFLLSTVVSACWSFHCAADSSSGDFISKLIFKLHLFLHPSHIHFSHSIAFFQCIWHLFLILYGGRLTFILYWCGADEYGWVVDWYYTIQF